MIAVQNQSMHDSVTGALRDILGRKVRVVRPGLWTIDRPADIRLSITLFEDWLQLSAPVAGGHMHGPAVPRCAWDLLKTNAPLTGSAKIVIPPGGDAVMAVRELWLASESASEADDADAMLRQMLREAIDDFDEAMGRLAGRGRERGRDAEPAALGENALVEMCGLARWPCNRRAEGRVTVQLDVPGSYALAMLHPGPRIRVVLELPLQPRELSPLARQAIGTVMLQLAGHVRWVRASVLGDESAESAVLESQLGPAAAASDLGEVLSAMSVAAGMSIRELPALADETIAEKYLTIRGWSS